MQVSVRIKAMHHATSVAYVLEKRPADSDGNDRVTKRARYAQEEVQVEPEPEPDIAQQRAAAHQMTVWDNVGGEDNPIELSDSDDEL